MGDQYCYSSVKAETLINLIFKLRNWKGCSEQGTPFGVYTNLTTMQKYNNPRLSGTVVAGTGMDHPVRPHVIVGDTKMGYVRGDLMDANSVEEIHIQLNSKIDQETTNRTNQDTQIKTSISSLQDDIKLLKEEIASLKQKIDETQNNQTN